MKNLEKKLFLVVTIIFCINFTIYAQESSKEIIFIFNKNKGKLSRPYAEKAVSDVSQLNRRCTDFSISGLETQQQVDKLIQDVKKNKGITDFSISSEIVDNQRKASVIFYESINIDFFKKIFLENNIKNIIVDGKKISAEKFEYKTNEKNKGDSY
jgi:hypothetical protein